MTNGSICLSMCDNFEAVVESAVQHAAVELVAARVKAESDKDLVSLTKCG